MDHDYHSQRCKDACDGKTRHHKPSRSQSRDYAMDEVSCLKELTHSIDQNGPKTFIKEYEAASRLLDGEFKGHSNLDLMNFSKTAGKPKLLAHEISSKNEKSATMENGDDHLQQSVSTALDPQLSIDNIDDFFFICEVCCKDFDEKNHVPRVLPCLHTVCQKCLDNRVRECVLICPVCRYRHTLNGESLDCFPKENTRRTLRDLVDLSRPDRSVMCRDCPDNGQACCFCRQCYAFLCGECRRAHSRNFITRDHRLVGLEKIKNCGIEPFQRKQTCRIKGHEGQQLAYFCEKKSCFTSACKMCVVLEHDRTNGHVVKKLQDVYRHHKSCVVDLMQNLKDKIDLIKNVADDADAEMQELEKKEVFISNDIDKEIDKGIQMLETRREELKQILRTKCKEKKEVLGKQKDLLKYNLRLMRNANDFSAHEISFAMPAEFVVLAETICGRLVSLQDRPFDTMPLDNSFVHFDKAVFSSGISDFVSKIGHIRTTNIHPPETKVETFEVAVDSSAEVLKVLLYDINGFLQSNGNDCIRVTIKSPTGRISEGLIESDQIRNGSYRVFYAAREVGDHIAYVQVLGRLVCEEGFVFKVKSPGEIDRSFGEITCPGFIYDETTVHPEREVAENGRKLKSDACQLQSSQSVTETQRFRSSRKQNLQLDRDSKRQNYTSSRSADSRMNGSPCNPSQGLETTGRRLQKYCGVIGSKPFKIPGKYYYEVTVSYSVQLTLVRNTLVFEIGIGRLGSIRNSFYVGSQVYGWSFSVERCDEHRQLCHKFRHNRKLILHTPTSSDAAGTSATKTYGFLLDTARKQWSVIDCAKRKILYCFTDVDFSETLWPVFGTYNPFSVYVEMLLNTGNAIKNIPEIATQL